METLRDKIRSSVRSLPTIARIRLLLEISRDELEQFERELERLAARYAELERTTGQVDAADAAGSSALADDDREPTLLAEDRSPYSRQELKRMRRETGGRPLAEILNRLGLS